MIILSSIYQVLIGPLELFFEVVYSFAYQLIGDPGFAIVFLSLAMNFLVLPLYRRADAMQEAERDRSMRMKPAIDHIKKTFTGDERFMMLQTYYRQNNYKQTDALKGSISLLLEIPFFIAAYYYLSELSLLNGVSFGPIPDLGAPDALLTIGTMSINVLPLLMTAINVISAAVYMKGFPLSSKIQMYGIAAIFLVLLYNSPAGLVFYWTLNNIFSLIKNLFYKLAHPGKVLAIMASVAGIALFILAFALPALSVETQVFFIVCAVLLQIPISVSLLRRASKLPNIREATKKDDRAFFLGCLFLALLTGVLIPVTVIQASPSEFVNLANYKTPLRFVLDSALIAFGTFVIWFGIFYRLASPKGRSIFGAILLAACGIFLVDYLFFGTDYGNLSPLLEFDVPPTVTLEAGLTNLAAIVALTVILLLIWHKWRGAAGVAYTCMCVAIAAVSIFGMVQINTTLDNALGSSLRWNNGRPHFTLSRNGQNVIVVMMDRAISDYVPYIIEENPRIGQQLDGFTFYPNAMSYGSLTITGSPGLYGGYEYIPENMNERDDVFLVDKQNEALRVMPLLFIEAGYDVTVFDPTYAGYTWTPDLSIYSDTPGISAYVTMAEEFETDEFGPIVESDLGEALQSRNFFCYSIFKVAPQFVHPALYDEGRYHTTMMLTSDPSVSVTVDESAGRQIVTNASVGQGLDNTFLKAYAILQNLPEMTEISDTGPGGFLMMSNDTTHSPTILKEPECIPALTVDNTDYDLEHETRTDADGNILDLSNDSDQPVMSKHIHYEINTAAWRELGNWFDYLREQGVYDNTRIIIVSDHGQHLSLHDDLIIERMGADGIEHWDTQIFNCLLMVKDFNATGFTVDKRFMTNADTPLLAFEGIVDNPINPSTGKVLDDAEKYEAQHHVQWPSEWSTDVNNGTTFMPGHWFSLSGDDVLDGNSWHYLGYY